MSRSASPMTALINSKNKEIHSHPSEKTSKSEKTSEPENVKDLEDDLKDSDYMSCDVKIKDCLPNLFELYKNKRFLPYMTGGVIHKGVVYKPDC